MASSIDIERKNMFKDAVSNLEFCVEQVIKQLEGEDRNSQLKELKTVMLEYCDLDNQWKLEKRICGEMERSLAEEFNMNKIDEVYANLKKKQNEADPYKHEWYLNLEKKISQLLSCELIDPDGDIIDMGSTQTFKDPFTKNLMTFPVRNTCCGHNYDRDTVMEILERKKEMRCPIVGCKYGGYFNRTHLEDNRDLLRQIKHLKNN